MPVLNTSVLPVLFLVSGLSAGAAAMHVATRFFGRRPAPEFEAWLARQGLLDTAGRIRPRELPRNFRNLLPT